ncbi:LOW QUALITY PROTEIN: WD40 domain-containing protein [Cephalotus follicularis]|uniref:WD40 domain-containing protein n=1 Tax=Cephalotus follicularis TaxID=3775 RepID=A0A1Q3ANK8_CEPFO|nr:LOW QUALITY PROTEIN: WD40 domain-containing protein [Cephalotus follicularis]
MDTLSTRRSVYDRLGRNHPRIFKPPHPAKPQQPHKKLEKICKYWVSGNCVYGDAGCRYLHSWFDGKDFSRLEGHKKALTVIAFPSGSDKLYIGGRDGTLRVWDCNSGQCVKFFNLGDQIGCLIGLTIVVKAWNANNAETVFDGTGAARENHY